MLDLDHFKRINDTHGHPFGDFVLKKVADLLTGSLRSVDIVARYGGEEIVIACPETNIKQAGIVADRIRSKVESTRLRHEGLEDRITTSIGVTVFPDDRIQDADDLLRATDEALYSAKDAGRNCIRFAFGDELE
jgi:diguanylate cyclase